MTEHYTDRDGLTLAQRVQLRLTALDLTQTQVSQELGKRDFVGQLLRGEKTRIHDRNLAMLAKILKTTPRYLATGQEEPKAAKPVAPDRSAFFRPGVPPHLRSPEHGAAKVDEGKDRKVPTAQAPESAEEFEAGQRLTREPFPSASLRNRLKPLPKISKMARSRGGGETAGPAMPARTGLPVFHLQVSSVGDMLNINEFTWIPRPHDLIGCPDAYGVRLCRDIAVGWRSGSLIILTPNRDIAPHDVVLSIAAPSATGNHLVVFREFIAADLKTGFEMRGLSAQVDGPSGVPLPRIPTRRIKRLHRVHSMNCP
ncbi:MAG: hypothetical protein Devi2KO_28640 [Devosia indica]